MGEVSSAFEEEDDNEIEMQQQRKQESKSEEEDWSNHDDDLKFDDDDENIHEQVDDEQRRATIHNTITSAHGESIEQLEEDSILKNVAIVLGFLLHKKSPLWSNKRYHHSTRELIKNKRRKIPTFPDRCSIFKSDYSIGHEMQKEEEMNSPLTKEKSMPAQLLAGIKEGPQQLIFNKIIKEHIGDMDAAKEKW